VHAPDDACLLASAKRWCLCSASGRAINTAVRPRLTSYTRQHHERARTASDMQTMDWEHAGPPPPPPATRAAGWRRAQAPAQTALM